MDNHEDLLTGLTSGQMNCKRGYVRELVPCHELINHFSSFFFFFFFYNVTEEKLVLECAEEPRRKPVAGRSWNCRESNVHIQCTYKYQVHSKFCRIVHFEICLSFYFCLFFFYFVTRKFYASQVRDRAAQRFYDGTCISTSVEYYHFRVSWQITLDHGDLFHFVSCVFQAWTEAT